MKNKNLKRISSFIISAVISLTSLNIPSTAEIEDDFVIVNVKVMATDKTSKDDVAVNDALVNVYYNDGHEDAVCKGTFLTKNIDGEDGYAECKIELPSDIAGNEDKINEYISKLTFSAKKVVESGKGIDGDQRDALFSKYEEDRLQLELHSETIDFNGQWLGAKLPEIKGNEVDLAFVIDTTGSMYGSISNVKNNITEFAKYLEEQGLDLRMSVIEYRDITVDGEDSTKQHLIEYSPWHKNTDQLVKTLTNIMVSGGGDIDETPIDALHELIGQESMNWRSSANKFAFLLTDAGYKIDNLHNYTSLKEIANKLAKDGIMTSVISETYYKSTYADLYNTTGGQFVNISSHNFANELNTLADGIIGKVNKELELHLSEPRLLVDMSVCYYADTPYTMGNDGGNDEYYNNIKAIMKEYSKTLADATDGHIMLNKVYTFYTDNRENFYVSDFEDAPPISAMADIRIENRSRDKYNYSEDEDFYTEIEEDYNEPRILANANIGGFYDDNKMYSNFLNPTKTLDHFINLSNEEIEKLKYKDSFKRIQMGKEVFTGDFLTHETGHYLMGLYDEYLSASGTEWTEGTQRPDGVKNNFGLMDNREKKLIELSKDKDYEYLGGNYSDKDINTKQSYKNKMSAESTLAKLLESGHIDDTKQLFETGGYEIHYTKSGDHDRTAEYKYAELTDEKFIDLRDPKNWEDYNPDNDRIIFDSYKLTDKKISELTVTDCNTTDINITPEIDGEMLIYERRNGESEPTKPYTLDAVPSKRYVMEMKDGETSELTVIMKNNGKFPANQYLIHHKNVLSDGYFYTSPNETVQIYFIPDKDMEVNFITIKYKHYNDEYISVNDAMYINTADSSTEIKGEIYSVAHIDSEIDYSSVSWFLLRDGEYTKLETSLSEEKNMNIGAVCDYAGEGIYVLMAKLASGESMLPVTNIKYTNADDRDGIVNLTFDDPNENTEYYNIYYSDEPFTSTADKGVAMQKYHAGSDSYTLDLKERNKEAYSAIIAVSGNGAKSPLSDIIKVNTGEADRDHDGIPDWYDDKYDLWPKDGEEKDIANSDDDGDGLTNKEEYDRGTNPKDPNDPVKTTNIPVFSVSLDNTDVTVAEEGEVVINALINPDNATNKDIKWYIDDDSVAEIEPVGLSCRIKGIVPGKTKVTAVTVDGGYTISADVTITSINIPTGEWTGATTGASGEVSWMYSNGILTISGSGKMEDYSLTSPAPWSVKIQNRNLIKEVVFVGEGVKTIGAYAFYDLPNLEKLTISNSIYTIGDSAFEKCNTLANIDFPISSYAVIGKNAFKDCIALNNVMIPSTVTGIAIGAFEGCVNISKLTIPFIGSQVGEKNNIDVFSYIFNGKVPENLKTVIVTNETNIPDKAFEGCSYIENILVNEGIKTMGTNSFKDCHALKEFKIPDGVKNISSRTFQNCYSVENIEVPDSVNEIGVSAFDGCGSLTDIDVPDGVSYIEDYTFRNCTSLKSINIPDSVKSIGLDVLQGCTGIVGIKIPFIGSGAETNLLEPSEEGVFGYLFGKSEIGIVQGEYTYAVPSSVTKVEITNTGDNKYIPPAAFINCANIEDIIIDGGDAICKDAFRNCRLLKNLYLPRNVDLIQDNVLVGCTSIKTLTIPFIGRNKSDNNKETSVLGYLFGWSDESDNPADVEQQYNAEGESHFYHIPATLKNVSVLAQTEIPYGAFAGCKNLECVSIVTSAKLNDKAFYNCKKLRKVTLPSNMIKIGEMAFAECSSLEYVNIPQGTEAIGSAAFYNDRNLKEVTIPKSVELIADTAFRGIISYTTHGETAILSDTYNDVFTIVCSENSTAHKFAEKNGIKTRLVDEKNLDIRNTATTVEQLSDDSYMIDIIDTNSMENIGCSLFIALYDDKGGLVDVIIRQSGSDEYRINIDKYTMESAKTVKIFIWDMDKFIPMTSTAENYSI